ncbi:MAG: prohibitin family protein [Chitinophagales bacterium]|jgi:regulator of protease activity HflC (stomatin/prohibitin superfamily)|nr:prohibitin family protein [Sphingobacteriales bacterium]
MFLIILGVVLMVLSTVAEIKSPDEKLKTLFQKSKFIGIAIFIIGLLFSIFVQIGTGKVGVKTMFGKVYPETLSSGLHIVNPLYNITELDIKTQNYTMSGVHDEGAKQGDDAIKVLTADGLEVVIDLTVLYRVNASSAPKLLQNIGIEYREVLVRPITRTKIRDNAVYYEAIALYSSKRDEFQNRIFKTIEADFKNRGLILEQLLIRNIALPERVKKTIEEKIQAEQEAQKMQFVLQKERQEAERKRVEAQGISDYQNIINQSLTDRQLQYEQIKAYKELANSQNTKVIIMGKGSTPVILDSK